MTLRSIVAAALRGIAALVLVPLEIVVAGVRTVISVLRPARNTALSDMAEDVLDEDDSRDVLAAVAAAKDGRFQARLSEPERVRRAAAQLRDGRPIPAALLDPALPAEAEVRDWLTGLDQLHLSFLVRASDAALEAHLDGDKRLPVPLLPAAEAKAEARREAVRPLTKSEWVRELMRRAAEAGDEDLGPDDLDRLLDESDALVERNAALGDYAEAPSRELERVIDDREDVG